jgi:hypothetical protein
MQTENLTETHRYVRAAIMTQTKHRSIAQPRGGGTKRGCSMA